jgi:lysyl-tRNA synthetase class 2
MGNASFAELKDAQGRIQLYLTRDDISTDEAKTMYKVVFKKLLDIGDFIGIRGTVFKTKVGEISIHVYELKVLSKALKPLPSLKPTPMAKSTMPSPMPNNATAAVTSI